MNDTGTRSGFRNRCDKVRWSLSGFTLVEILLAIFIFSLMVSVIYGTFNAVVGSSGSIERDFHLNEAAKICLDRLVADLRAAYVAMPPFYKKPDMAGDPDPYRFQGGPEQVGGKDFSTLRFVSHAHLPISPGPGAGIVELSYYVEADPETGFVLKRAERNYPYPPFEKKIEDPILCEWVRSLSFSYIDDTDEVREEWDSESGMTGYATPRCVVIDLELGDEDRPERFRTAVALPMRREAVEP